MSVPLRDLLSDEPGDLLKADRTTPPLGVATGFLSSPVREQLFFVRDLPETVMLANGGCTPRMVKCGLNYGGIPCAITDISFAC